MNISSLIIPHKELEKMRRDCVKQFKASGMPDADANEIVDLGMHAATRATDLIVDICENASSHTVSHAAFYFANQLTIDLLKFASKGLKELAKARAASAQGCEELGAGE